MNDESGTMNHESGKSHVYFMLSGDIFDPDIITEKLGIKPTDQWKKGDKGTYVHKRKYTAWKISTKIGKEYIWIDKLVKQIVRKLNAKTAVINQLKKKFKLISFLEVVLYIDTNEKESTPALNFDNKTIEFLDKTNTKIDVDIYRFDSSRMKIKVEQSGQYKQIKKSLKGFRV